jgi:hypothetical protein
MKSCQLEATRSQQSVRFSKRLEMVDILDRLESNSRYLLGASHKLILVILPTPSNVCAGSKAPL